MYICVFDDYKALDFTPYLAEDKDEALTIALSDEYMNEGTHEVYSTVILTESSNKEDIVIIEIDGGYGMCVVRCYPVEL